MADEKKGVNNNASSFREDWYKKTLGEIEARKKATRWEYTSLRWVGRKLKFLIIILFVIGVIFVGLAWYRSGLGVTLIEHLGVTAKESSIYGTMSQGVETLQNLLFNPTAIASPYSFESQIEANEQNKNLGVKIKDISQSPPKVFSGDSVSLIGTVSAETLRGMKLSASCKLEDYPEKNNEIEIPAEIDGQSEIELYPGVPLVSKVTCILPEVKNEGETDVVGKEGAIFVKYDFTSIASHKTYFLEKSQADSILKKGGDPFEKFNEPLLKSDRTMTSVTAPGPMNLAIGTDQRQPFSEGKPYFIYVTLKSSSDWIGNLDTIKSIELQLPPNLYLEGESTFRGSSSETSLLDKKGELKCDFLPTGEKTEDGFKVYELKDETKERVNNINCNDFDFLRGEKLTEAECLSLYKKELRFQCRFIISEIPSGQGMFYDFIRAEAKYDYKSKKSKFVQIYKAKSV